MNRIIRARMLTTDRQRGREGYRTRDGREEYGPENRFRDRDGREHYDNGRFAPMDEGVMWVDGRTGPYAPPRAEYHPAGMHYPAGPMPYYPSPVYEGGGMEPPDAYRPMNRIGFSVGGEMERLPQELGHEYRSVAGYQSMDELSRRQGDGYRMGRGRAKAQPQFDREMAEEWTAHMENEDGTTGPHWSMERIQQEISQRGIACDPVKFWAVINSIYSDDVAVAKRHGVNTMDYYIDRAKAWLDDKDAVSDKAAAYYEYVVRH